jgi:hypothetical protein
MYRLIQWAYYSTCQTLDISGHWPLLNVSISLYTPFLGHYVSFIRRLQCWHFRPILDDSISRRVTVDSRGDKQTLTLESHYSYIDVDYVNFH